MICQPKIIFFDIDETLYIQAEQRIPESIFEQVLPRLKAKGIIPAIATGRCVGAFPDSLKPLLGKAGFEALVTINGLDNCGETATISSYPIATERVSQVIESLVRLGIPYGLIGRNDVALSQSNELIEQTTKPIKSSCILAPNFHLDAPIFQMWAFINEGQESAVLESGMLQNDLKMIRWHENAVDILAAQHSKAKGIRDVLAHFGLSMRDAMAFGDGLNDIEMLSSVGFGVAMGNAKPSVKAVADYVTKPIEQDGILFALEQLGVI